jgi:hypothetical protein
MVSKLVVTYDDAPPAALDHRLDREPRHQECADAVDREDALPALRVGLEKPDARLLVIGGGGHADARTIDEDVGRG